MYYNIYEVDTAPITGSMMDAVPIGEHVAFLAKGAVVEDLEEQERTTALQVFGKWIKKERLGELKKAFFILHEDVNCGKHFADRYAGFHRLAASLADVTEDDYLHRFYDVRNLASNLLKSVVDEDNEYVLINEDLLTMDEFLRQATPGIRYYIGTVCKYHR